MGWITDYRKKRAARTERKDGMRTYLIGGNDQGQGARDYAALVEEGFKANSDVQACCGEIAGAIAGIPWILEKKNRAAPRKEWEPIDDHPFYDLWENPCPPLRMTSSDYVDMLVTHLFLAGESITQMSGPTQGPPRELWVLQPDKVTIEKGGRFEPIKAYLYEYDPSKPKDVYKPSDIIHQKFTNPQDPYRGLSPLVAAYLAIDQGNHARRWNLTLMKNGGVPPGIMQLPDGTEAQLESDQQRMKFDEAFRAKVKALGTFFSGQGAAWNQIGLSPREVMWIESLNISTIDICKVMRVPPEIIGDTGSKQNANWKEGRQSFYTECVLPLMDRLRDLFNLALIPRFGADLYLNYDVTSIEALQEDETAKWARVKDAKFMTVDEKRAYVGLDEFPGDAGNVLILSPTDMPVRPEDLGAMADEEPEDIPAEEPSSDDEPDEDGEPVVDDEDTDTEDEKRHPFEL